MKKTGIWLIKAAIAALIAFGIMTGICCFYYNIPAHHTNETGATDYLWDKSSVSCRGTEGFARTYTDENGFVNTFPDKKAEVDILVMGSSHAEGFNVNADENFTYLLNKKLQENGKDKYAYSIATSGHALLRCMKNLDTAMDVYSPSEYVVIETAETTFDLEELKELDNGTFANLPSYSTGLIGFLQKVDVFRLLYAQFSNGLNKNEAGNHMHEAEANPEEREQYLNEYETYINRMIQKSSESAANHDCKIVIVYSPQIVVDYYGNMVEPEITQEEILLEDACRAYGIDFINMQDSFEEMYHETADLPHGFPNTAVGKGHTNKHGHNCIAETLYAFFVRGDCT